jgi:hypothetical protein
VSIVAVEAFDFGPGFLNAKVFAFGDTEVVKVDLEFHGRSE